MPHKQVNEMRVLFSIRHQLCNNKIETQLNTTAGACQIIDMRLERVQDVLDVLKQHKKVSDLSLLYSGDNVFVFSMIFYMPKNRKITKLRNLIRKIRRKSTFYSIQEISLRWRYDIGRNKKANEKK